MVARTSLPKIGAVAEDRKGRTGGKHALVVRMMATITP